MTHPVVGICDLLCAAFALNVAGHAGLQTLVS
jgi:hypothetical protein